MQSINSDVVWNIDRLAGEVGTAGKEVTRIENRMKISGSTRTVGDVDTDLEALDSQRADLDRKKDEILRRQSRLKWVCQYPMQSVVCCSEINFPLNNYSCNLRDDGIYAHM